MADNLWKIRLGEKSYDLEPRDLTVARLRACKQWFGKEYGGYLTFIQLLLQGDADACACAVWIVQTKAGEKPKEPRFMDFAVSDFFVSDESPEDDGEDPTSLPDTLEAESADESDEVTPTSDAPSET